jgi:hypothetical protein
MTNHILPAFDAFNMESERVLERTPIFLTRDLMVETVDIWMAQSRVVG